MKLDLLHGSSYGCINGGALDADERSEGNLIVI